MKKIVCLILLSLLVCGCDSKGLNNNKLTEETLKQIKENIDKNNKLIEELNAKNKELETKIVELSNEKEELKKNISTLQEKDKAIDKNIQDKYNELVKKINNSNSNSKYTITKEKLLGTWNYVQGNKSITFTNENLVIHDNWIEWKGLAFPYLYKNGKLYVSDDGVVLKK